MDKEDVVYIYTIVSNNTVLPATINNIVILLSLEKFLSKYPPKKPIVANIIEDIPKLLSCQHI